MALQKGKSNSGIKNLKSFPKGKSGYHFEKRTQLCEFCKIEYITTVQHSKYCSSKCREKCRPDKKPKGFKKQEHIECKFCGINFLDKARRLEAKFCSKQCSGMYMVATGNRNYVTKAMIHYPNICNRCGIDDDMVLCVHHIDHDRKNNDINNLEIVCANCHHKHHFGRTKKRRYKVELIKEFIQKNPEWRIENAPFKRKQSED